MLNHRPAAARAQNSSLSPQPTLHPTYSLELLPRLLESLAESNAEGAMLAVEVCTNHCPYMPKTRAC